MTAKKTTHPVARLLSLATVFQDVRFGIRMLWKNPGVTVFCVLALAVGIGANTALFSLIYSVLISPMPFPNPEKIMWVQTSWKNGGNGSCSGPDYLDWREQNAVFQGLCAMDTDYRFSLTGMGEPKALVGFKTTTDFFEVMGSNMLLGRTFLPEESESGKSRVAIVSHRFWKNQFDSDPDIVGKQITLSEQPWTVVGVAPPLMGFIEDMAQLYAPLTNDELKRNRSSHYLGVMGRLKKGVSVKQAQAEMDAIAARLAQQYVEENKNKGVFISSLHEMLVEDVKTAFLILYGSVGFLLLIACVNVANLLLAKSGVRSKEIAIRTALGANRFRIVRQVLTESVLLSVFGGVLGLMLAMWGMDALRWIAPSSGNSSTAGIPGFAEMGVNGSVLLFSLALSMLTGIVFGLFPALQISKTNLNEMMKESSRGSSSGSSRHNLLSALVVSEIALALILLMGASLLVKSFRNLQLVDPGFNSSNVLAVSLERPRTKENEENKNRASFYKRVVERVSALPGVESAAAINIHPMAPYNSNNGFQIEGRPLPVGEYHSAEYRIITADFFKTAQIPLIKGRTFTSADNERNVRVIVVNQEFVRRYFPNEEPLGKRIDLNGDLREIVGVVGNTKTRSLSIDRYDAFVYLPIDQDCWHEMTLLARAQGDPLLLASSIRNEVWNVDPNQAILSVRTMDRIVNDTVSVPRFCAILLTAMAGAALLLAIVGIYSVMAFSVQERIHEIGIRMALGARTQDVLKLVVMKGFSLTVIGLAIGLAGSYAVTRLLSGLLYQITATDPLIFIIAPLILLSVALLACYLPARRAARTDPMITLRCE